MEKQKKKWETPKLICLYRGRPEEAVLAQCKNPGTGIGPTSNKCDAWSGGGQCDTPSFS